MTTKDCCKTKVESKRCSVGSCYSIIPCLTKQDPLQPSVNDLWIIGVGLLKRWNKVSILSSGLLWENFVSCRHLRSCAQCGEDFLRLEHSSPFYSSLRVFESLWETLEALSSVQVEVSTKMFHLFLVQKWHKAKNRENKFSDPKTIS